MTERELAGHPALEAEHRNILRLALLHLRTVGVVEVHRAKPRLA